MNPLHEIQCEVLGRHDCRPDAICRALTPPGFVPALQAGADIAVRVVFSPSFDSELVLTLNRIQSAWQFDARSARASLWAHHISGIDADRVHEWLAKRILPLTSWGVTGICKMDAPLNALNYAPDFATKWQLRHDVARLDGCGIDACWVAMDKTVEFRQPGATPWESITEEFCANLLTAIRSAIDDVDAIEILDDVLAYFGVGEHSWRRRR